MGTVWAVVVAAGHGARFGGAKQFLSLAGTTVVERSIAASRSVAGGVVVVLPAGEAGEPWGADTAVEGGATRSASVRAGLAALPASAEIVVVHDAARPLASPALFSRVVEALSEGVAGAVCAIPVVDTLKEVAGDPPVVRRTVPRETLVAIQTPQAFPAGVLRRAHAAGAEATDDAALVESLGGLVRVVPGDPANIKITDPADLALAELLLGERR